MSEGVVNLLQARDIAENKAERSGRFQACFKDIHCVAVADSREPVGKAHFFQVGKKAAPFYAHADEKGGSAQYFGCVFTHFFGEILGAAKSGENLALKKRNCGERLHIPFRQDIAEFFIGGFGCVFADDDAVGLGETIIKVCAGYLRKLFAMGGVWCCPFAGAYEAVGGGFFADIYSFGFKGSSGFFKHYIGCAVWVFRLHCGAEGVFRPC